MTETFSATDLEVGYDESSAVTVTCSGSQVSVDGSGVTAENGQAAITGGGSFVLSGALNGQVCVDAKDEEIHLILKGIDITSSDSPAVYVKQASKVTVTLETDTDNSLTDSQTYTLAPGEDEPNACLYSKSDLTINGQGNLSVTGNYNHGIYCKDALSITGGEFNIASSDDGIHADGAVTIAGGSIHITESYEGVEGLSVTVTGGEIVLTASDDGVNAADGSGGDFPVGFGHMGASSDCFIRISGGSLEINAVGDGVDSNGTLYVDGGTLLVGGFTGSGDSALDYENTAEITGGTVIAAGSAGMAAGFTDGSHPVFLPGELPDGDARGYRADCHGQQRR